MKKKSLIDACQAYDFEKIENFLNQFHLLNGKELVSETKMGYHILRPCYIYDDWEKKHIQLMTLLLSNKLISKMVKTRQAPFENVFFDLLQTNNINIVEAFLKTNIDINQKNAQSYNALLYCIQHGHTKLIPLLIEKGIDINYKNNGKNALMLAILKEKEDIASLLIDTTIDINEEYTVNIGYKNIKTNLINLALDGNLFNVALKLIQKNDIQLSLLENTYFYLDDFLPNFVVEIKEALEEKINIVYEKSTIEKSFKTLDSMRQKKVKI
jgi:hypothetical protein